VICGAEAVGGTSALSADVASLAAKLITRRKLRRLIETVGERVVCRQAGSGEHRVEGVRSVSGAAGSCSVTLARLQVERLRDATGGKERAELVGQSIAERVNRRH
jgi:hypothetical protein